MRLFILSHGFIQDGASDKVLHLCKHLRNMVRRLEVAIFTKGRHCKEALKDIVPLCEGSRTTIFDLWVHERHYEVVEDLYMKSFRRLLKSILKHLSSMYIAFCQRELVTTVMVVDSEKDRMRPLMEKGTVLGEGVVSKWNPVLSVLRCSTDLISIKPKNKRSNNRPWAFLQKTFNAYRRIVSLCTNILHVTFDGGT